MPLLNVTAAIASWLALTTGFCIYFLPNDLPPSVQKEIYALLFFNNLNIFIALCEIALGMNIMHIKSEYLRLREQYKGKEWDACLAFLTTPLTFQELFSGKAWSLMWSTYSLYDPSYQNYESFGFFIDFGNGMSTIPPCLLMNYALISPQSISPLFVGCVGIAMYWQVMYGTIIYVLSFMFNRRYEGKSTLEVALFVGISNSLWFFFPIFGIHLCVLLLRDGSMF